MKWGRYNALFVCLACYGISSEESGRLSGRVNTETQAPVGGVRLVLRCGNSNYQTLTTPTGEFTLEVPASLQNCRLSAEREGFFPIRDREIAADTDLTDLRIILTRIREINTAVEVTDNAAVVDLDTVSTRETLTTTDILNIPYTSTNNLRNALQTMPGVVQSPQGTLHVNGGAADQTLYTLDGFNLADPLTGRFDTRLSVEAVQAVHVAGGAQTAEFGKGSAGSMSIRSRSGDDRFRASATNFFPGFEFRKGVIIGDFMPRFNLSGPIRRGRAWFYNGTDLQYQQHVVPELPKGEDRTYSWRWSNLLSTQINITPGNILFGGFLTNGWTAPRTGLSVLDPLETTVDRRARQWFGYIKDQIYFQRGALVEFGYAGNRTFGREVPQGHDLLIFTPEGKRGNFFRNSRLEGSRDQLLVNAFLPSFEWKGGHQIKAGVDLNRVSFRQDALRTGFIQQRADGSTMRKVLYEGNGLVEIQNHEASAYLTDQWKPRPGMLVDAGLRWDWDRIVRRNNFAPRVGFAWSPSRWENTRISGNTGLVYDASNLSLFARREDQFAMATYFDPAGEPVRGPAASIFLPTYSRLRSPGVLTWSAAVEHRFPSDLHLQLSYLGRRGLKGLAWWNSPGAGNPTVDALYRLTNYRQDRYDAFEITARQVIQRQYEWLVSYIRSSARSNAAVDVSIDEPFFIPDNNGPMAWDTPNRLLGRAYLPTPWKSFALATLIDYRTGFPYSVIGEDGRVRGPVNSQRFPDFFEANIHLEWKLGFAGRRWALRGGFNNITGRKNPVVVNNIAGASNFLQLYGGYGRSLNFRIRFLGK